jgi:hypothetical protein
VELGDKAIFTQRLAPTKSQKLFARVFLIEGSSQTANGGKMGLLMTKSEKCQIAEEGENDSRNPLKNKVVAQKKPVAITTGIKSGRKDLNLRPSDPQSDALSRLRHAPIWDLQQKGAC